MVTLSRWKVVLVILSVVLGLLFALPNALPQSVRDGLPGFMPRQTLNLGLDLQGGSYLLLEVDTDALRSERLTNMVEDVRTTLREEQIAFADLGPVNGGVNVRIVDPGQVDAAARVLRNTIGSTIQGAVGGRDTTVQVLPGQTLRLTFIAEAFEAEAKRAVDQSIEIIRRRIDELGTREPTIQRQGSNRIVVAAAGESDPERLKEVLGKTAKLTFHLVDENADVAAAMAGRVPPGKMLMPGEGGQPPLVVDRRALVTGEMLTDAQPGFDQMKNEPIVSFRFNGLGTRRFGDATIRNVGRRFAIVLDNQYISAPSINEPITGGSGQISGSFTVESANDLALVLRAGALPTRLNVEEQRTVGAELGADAIAAGQISAIGAFVLVLAFMVVAYGFLFGGVSILALLVNGLLIIAAMSITQASLTLPGIAGLILTLAVAVDANVLIYERMREEMRAGRTVIAAIDAGFNRAMLTIFDANITHLGAALIMFSLGAGPVKGFAWTLAIGVFTSVFTAVLITQVILALWLRTTRPKFLPIQ
ncbi:MAG: protein translocase subunit SecD [Phenylobacterium sp.]|uniref:protein translocase subunit SecD n=1 Tax=Phenylobacterium sp. TaxID=1871053 RepID=UPI001A5476B8|nr:protein translocase subunit SecD [Phenylobacterium sp.]MBL8772150.1 protein translocase subunit SecD [Phenylobacterium sp.]